MFGVRLRSKWEMSGNIRQFKNIKHLVYIAEEFEFYPVGNKKSLKDFKHKNNGSMSDYSKGIMQAIDTGDGNSWSLFKNWWLLDKTNGKVEVVGRD